MKNTQKPSAMPMHKYRPYSEQFAVDLPDRTWPDQAHHGGTHAGAPSTCATATRRSSTR